MIQKTVNGVVTRFFYNIEDRLVRVEDNQANVIAEYTYDPFGRRLTKTVSGTTTYYLYSDEGLIAEYTAAGTEIKAYGWKPGTTWGTDPLFMKQNGEYYFYHNDHLGTPQKMTAVNGAVVWSAKYSSFLDANVDTSSTITNNLRAPGQYFDEETGLHYNWYRYYDPTIGRYLTSDPIGLVGGINSFVYSLNNPINYIDPYGLKAVFYEDEFGVKSVHFTNLNVWVFIAVGEAIGPGGERGGTPFSRSVSDANNPDGSRSCALSEDNVYYFTIEDLIQLDKETGRSDMLLYGRFILSYIPGAILPWHTAIILTPWIMQDRQIFLVFLKIPSQLLMIREIASSVNML